MIAKFLSFSVSSFVGILRPISLYFSFKAAFLRSRSSLARYSSKSLAFFLYFAKTTGVPAESFVVLLLSIFAFWCPFSFGSYLRMIILKAVDMVFLAYFYPRFASSPLAYSILWSPSESLDDCESYFFARFLSKPLTDFFLSWSMFSKSTTPGLVF